MRKIVIAFLFTVSIFSASAQNASVIKLKEFQELLNRKTDTTYVINFWATWCAPCVAELPDFLKAEAELKDKKVKFYFINLNFKKEFESLVLPFLKKKEMKSTVYLLNEPDYNSWIDKVSPSWSGAIPATLIISKPDSNVFTEGSYTYEMLTEVLKNKIK